MENNSCLFREIATVLSVQMSAFTEEHAPSGVAKGPKYYPKRALVFVASS